MHVHVLPRTIAPTEANLTTVTAVEVNLPVAAVGVLVGHVLIGSYHYFHRSIVGVVILLSSVLKFELIVVLMIQSTIDRIHSGAVILIRKWIIRQ